MTRDAFDEIYEAHALASRDATDPILAATQVTLRMLLENIELHRTAWANAKSGSEYERQAEHFSVLWRATKCGWRSYGKLALYQMVSRRGSNTKNVAKGFKEALKRQGFDYDTLDGAIGQRGRRKGSKDSKKRRIDWGADDPSNIR